MEFDDAEWVVTDGDDYGDADDAGWVMADAGAISGVFFHASGRPAYAAFDPRAHPTPDPSLSFFPPSVSVRAASNGLLCLRGPWSTYYVCNPATARCATLPRPLRHNHGRDSAIALIFDPDANPRPEYLLVCALEVPSGGGAPVEYRFETFSSATGAWRTSIATFVTGGWLVPASGVSSDGVAYWRTADGAVVAYDPATDDARIVPAPSGCGEPAARWELGEAGGRLCCACVTDDAMEVFALGPSDEWVILASFSVAAIGKEDGEAEWEVGDESIMCRESPWPLRFQSENLEVVLWVDGRVVGLDLESRRVRVIPLNAPAPGCLADYVSHVNTLAPVLP